MFSEDSESPTNDRDVKKPRRTPYFPHVRMSKDKTKATPLNTAENFQALLDFHNCTIKQNRMNLEMEFYRGNNIQTLSFESMRSQLISWASVAGLSRECIADHVYAISEKHSVHPVRNWLENGQWDGITRVEHVISCFNAKDPATAQLVLQHWLIGCVAALYAVPFSSKLVPVIVGAQSDMKTTAIARICNVIDGAFLEGAELNPDNKDSILSVIRTWIVELGELERTSRNSQGGLKAFITRAHDTIRPPYARTDVRKARQTNMIATVNGTGFLKDETGNSRYAVIELAQAVDIESMNSLLGWRYQNGRVQLAQPDLLKQFWLEIKSWYDAGRSWNLSPEHVAQLAQKNDQHSDKGVWYDYLLEKYVTVDEQNCIKKFVPASFVSQSSNIDRRQTRQIGQALSRLAREGKIRSEDRRSNVKFYELKFPVSSDSCYD